MLSDTHPEIERRMIEGMRRMTPGEKAQKIAEMWEVGEYLAMADIRRHYPHADAWELKMRVASRRLPPELLKKAFGWDVEEKGY